MIFPTLEFAAFFAIVLPVSWLLMPYRRAWKIFLIAASYFFYGWADIHFTLLLAGETIWTQSFAVLLGRFARDGDLKKWILGIGIAGDLALLGWFKYYGFFVSNVAVLTSRLGLPLPLPLIQVALPVGISFFTFMAISYLVDIYRGQIGPVRWLNFALFLSFFPHLVAGPIVRVGEIVPQFVRARNPNRIEAARAFGLITGGLLKKVVLADLISTNIVDPVFSSPALHSRVDVLAAIYGYAVQIYCDFSAYADMAIGIALLLGIQFPMNFNRPYTAITLQDFWHRWHMTLSRWLRDYLYIPLGGNRKGPGRTYVNLMVTMLLGGLWHGAAWNFVIWGGIHGSGLAAERRWHDQLNRVLGTRWLRWFVTFQVVCIAWIFFRAAGLDVVQTMFHQLIFGGGETVLTPTVALAIAVGLGIQFLPREPLAELRVMFARLNPVVQGVALAGVLFVTSVVVTGQGVAPFIYYRF